MIADRGQGLDVSYTDLCSFLIRRSPYTLISGGIKNRNKGSIQAAVPLLFFPFLALS